MEKNIEIRKKFYKLVIENKVSKKFAANKLGLSEKQLKRNVDKYLLEGDSSLTHKNKGKENHNKTSNKIIKQIINLYITEFYDYNFSHFYEVITSKEYNFKISYSTLVRIFTLEDIISPEAWNKTRKLYNKEMKNAIIEDNITMEKKDLYNYRIEENEKKLFRKSINYYSFGQEVQMDATMDLWFGDEITFLHLAVDKATKKVLYGYFDFQETSECYYKLLYNLVSIYGIPRVIRTDKRNTFSNNNDKNKKNLTQFGSICSDLNIILQCSSEATFKPNVERENKTIKGRLKAEFRRNNIKNISEANEYFLNIFLPHLNNKFSYDINKNKNMMEKNHYSSDELNLIISERFTRKIDTASSLKYKNFYYIPVDPITEKNVSIPHKTEVTIIIAYDKTNWCIYNEKYYQLKKIENDNLTSCKKVDRGIYKPADNHAWRNYKN